jgi:hypothetical protein
MKRRLEMLEARSVRGASRGPYGQGTSERGWERFFCAHENARRESHSLEPLPELL